MLIRLIAASGVAFVAAGCYCAGVPNLDRNDRNRPRQALPDRPVDPDRLTHVLQSQAVYFLHGPHQIAPADGIIPAGTRVEVLDGVFTRKAGYTAIRTENGIEAYVASARVVRADAVRTNRVTPTNGNPAAAPQQPRPQ